MEGKEGQGEQWESPAFQGAFPGCPQEECWILGPLLQDRLLGGGACHPHHRRRGWGGSTPAVVAWLTVTPVYLWGWAEHGGEVGTGTSVLHS